jgi:hypothetical protein
MRANVPLIAMPLNDVHFIRDVTRGRGPFFIVNRMSRRMWQPSAYDASRPRLPKRRREASDFDYVPPAVRSRR